MIFGPTCSFCGRLFTAALTNIGRLQGSSVVKLLLVLASPLLCQGAEVIQSDICVYGGTSGGVVAAANHPSAGGAGRV